MKYFIPPFLFLATFASAQVITYDPPAEIQPSIHYTVEVNGKKSFVYQAPIATYTIFDMRAPVTIRIKANQDIKWVDVRPKKLNIMPVFGPDSTITFTISEPCKLSVELNGKITMPLFLFANEFEKERPDVNDPNIIYFKKGKVHHVGVLNVTSGKTVYIEGGAIVEGAIHAANAKNVTIRGRGVIDGSNNIKAADYLRCLEFKDCEQVEVEGVTLHNGTTWQVVPLHSDGVLIHNINIISDNASDDGIDVARSTNVTIDNCFIRTKDDCIAIKANFDYPPTEIVNNITVTNCVFWNALWGNALEIGFELRAKEVKNITFRNCDVIHVEAGAVFSIHNADQSVVHDILFEDIRVEDARHKLFDLAILVSQYSLDAPSTEAERKKRYLNGAWDGVTHVPSEKLAYHAQYRGWIKDVTFRNISVEGIFPFSIFYGFDSGHRVENIRIENLVVNGKRVTSKDGAKIYEENASHVVLK
jgi:hypothetical protein